MPPLLSSTDTTNHLHSLRRVDDSHNALHYLPIALFQLDSLRHLNLSHNQLMRLLTGKRKELDDVNMLLINPDHLLWSCHQLDELDHSCSSFSPNRSST
jgi:hypothetical protein